MHMADALLAPEVATTMYVASTATAAVAVSRLRKAGDTKKVPVMAVTAALVFAGQMINYSIPGTGASGHICGGMLLTGLLGPWAGFLSMVAILTIQCLFFADGGLLALGANIWNMAFYGCFAGYYLIWKPLMRSNAFKGVDVHRQNRSKIALASVAGCILTLQLGSLSVVTETYLSGITELPFGAFVGIMQPIHLVIGLIEGMITAAVLLFIYEARPELLMDMENDGSVADGRLSIKNTVVVLAVVAALVGGGLSLVASSDPDGLEWSMFGNPEAGYTTNMGLNEDGYGLKTAAAEKAEQVQKKTAVLPDYSLNADRESAAGTSLSGLIGTVLVGCMALVICFIGGLFRKRKKRTIEQS